MTETRGWVLGPGEEALACDNQEALVTGGREGQLWGQRVPHTAARVSGGPGGAGNKGLQEWKRRTGTGVLFGGRGDG